MSAARPSTTAPISAMPGRRWCSTCSPAAPPRLRRGQPRLCPQRHRRRRQDHRCGPRPRASSPRVITERYERHYLEDMGALGVPPPDLAPHATDNVGEMIAMIARLIETGNAYEADGHVLFHVPSRSRLRRARPPRPRRDDRRRPGRGRDLQEGPGRFRAVEAVAAGRDRLGQPLGPRPARLAYRMLGDDRAPSRRDDRHSWRRPRPHLPAPRERDRPEPLRPRRRAARALLGP